MLLAVPALPVRLLSLPALQMDGASAAVLSVLPKAASAIISAATNAEGHLSAAQPQVGGQAGLLAGLYGCL